MIGSRVVYHCAGINFIKLWQKVNGKKRKVARKFFEAFFGIQQKFCTNFIQKYFVKWHFCHLRKKSGASHKKSRG
jgi:hypothetical protein